MSDVAIRVSNLGKQYKIGARRQRADTLRDALAGTVKRFVGQFGAGGRPGETNTIWALKDVSFEVKRGEVLGVIGRNGAGKSTLLKILSRITEPTTGEVDLHGRVGSLLEVGTGFHAELSGRENIYLNGAIIGMKRREIQRRFDEIVDFAGVEQFIDTPVKHYSSGMYMRLAFAVAAYMETEILMVDEVLAVGDAEFQKKCLGKMGEVARDGRTVLFVSHNMNAVEQLCSRAVLLESGHLQTESSEVRSVIKQYIGLDGASGLRSEWVNTRNEFDNPWFRPTRFFISDGAGEPRIDAVSNASPFFVQIEGDIRELDSALTIGYAIYTEGGLLLYWSYQTDVEANQWPKLHTGHCVLRGPIPFRLLNEGVYRIELIGSLHYRKWLFEPLKSAPSIYLVIQGGLSDSVYWMVKRYGVLAPVIPWQLVS